MCVCVCVCVYKISNHKHKVHYFNFHIVLTIIKGTSGSVMVSKLDLQTYTSEFESHWVPHSYGFVPHLSKKLSKLPQSSNRKVKKVGWLVV